jgi:hypothetical protein
MSEVGNQARGAAMPTKTHPRKPAHEVRPYRPTETELFPKAICGQMAQALGIDAPVEITKLYDLLNDPGSFAQIAAYVEKFGIRPAGQRAALKGAQKALAKALERVEQLDWQSNEDIAAAYAQENAVFTAHVNMVSSPYYTQRNRDLASARRLERAIAFAGDNLYTASKSKLGINIRHAKYLIAAYEEFTGEILRGERSDKGDGNGARRFLEIGVNHITEGRLSVAQIKYVIRAAAEMSRRQR